MDLEVDSNCTSNCNPIPGTTTNQYLANGQPSGAAEWNIAVTDNTFANGGGGNWVETQGPDACIPQKNWTFSGNTLDANTGWQVDISGSLADPTCASDSQGLVVSNNVAQSFGGSLCSASIGQPGQGCPSLSVGAWSDVSISGNSMNEPAGLPTYYPNTPWVNAIGLCGVAGATVTNNTFNNAYAAVVTYNCFQAPAGATSGLTACNNTYWLTQPILGVPADPKVDATCS